MAATFDFFQFTHESEERMSGYYCSQGLIYATNGYIAVKVPKSYPAEFEGKTVSRTGNFIDATFPRVDNCIPELNSMEQVEFDFDAFKKELKEKRRFISLNRKIESGESATCFVNIDGVPFDWNVFNKAVYFASYYPSCRLYISKGKNLVGYKTAVLTDGSRYCVFVPRNLGADVKFDGLIGFSKYTPNTYLEDVLFKLGRADVIDRVWGRRSPTSEDLDLIALIKSYYKKYICIELLTSIPTPFFTKEED